MKDTLFYNHADIWYVGCTDKSKLVKFMKNRKKKEKKARVNFVHPMISAGIPVG